MKLHASRGRRDFEDLDVLVRACDVESRAEAVALFENAYPEHVLKHAAERWLDAHLR